MAKITDAKKSNVIDVLKIGEDSELQSLPSLESGSNKHNNLVYPATSVVKSNNEV